MVNSVEQIIADRSKIIYLCKGFDLFNHQYHVLWAWV